MKILVVGKLQFIIC